MEQAIKFIPLMLSTLALGIASFMVKKKNKLPWLIVAFIIWLLTFLYAIGMFNK
jgi:hypothetical protein